MVSAWYFADSEEDPRELHQFVPNQPVSLEALAAIGVKHWHICPDKDRDQVEVIAKERNYASRDEITISKEKLPNYEEKLKIFFTEHIHEDEEIRYILEGSGFFDIRDKEDRWVRIHTEKGDMIILPAGSYHRFILDSTNYIKAMRLFKEDPKWTPINRSAETDTNAFRVKYVAETLSNNKRSAEDAVEDKEDAHVEETPIIKKVREEPVDVTVSADVAVSNDAVAEAAEPETAADAPDAPDAAVEQDTAVATH